LMAEVMARSVPVRRLSRAFRAVLSPSLNCSRMAFLSSCYAFCGAHIGTIRPSRHLRWRRQASNTRPQSTSPNPWRPTVTGWQQSPATALLILADGTRLGGRGIGAVGHAAGEVCFNTAMTGYQGVLTDPSYAGQIVTFTFPHIGNVGTNDEDIETVNMAALSGVRGVVLKADITNPSNYRAAEKLDAWLKKRNIVGIAGIDT